MSSSQKILNNIKHGENKSGWHIEQFKTSGDYTFQRFTKSEDGHKITITFYKVENTKTSVRVSPSTSASNADTITMCVKIRVAGSDSAEATLFRKSFLSNNLKSGDYMSWQEKITSWASSHLGIGSSNISWCNKL